MRDFGASKRQTMGALWRAVLLCLLLVAAFARSEGVFAARSGQDAQHLHRAQTMLKNPDLHPDGACQGMGHCAPVCATAASALNIAPLSGARMVFAYADAPIVPGRRVDPAPHPPRLSLSL